MSVDKLCAKITSRNLKKAEIRYRNTYDAICIPALQSKVVFFQIFQIFSLLLYVVWRRYNNMSIILLCRRLEITGIFYFSAFHIENFV